MNSEIKPATARKPADRTEVLARWQKSFVARKTPRHLEDDLQAACVKWFRAQYAPLAGLLFAIPNGGNRNPREGARLKAQGVTAGVPDLLLAYPKKDFHHGMFLELKVGKNKPTKEQTAYLNKLWVQGYAAEVVYTFEEFQALIKDYIGY